MQKSNFKYLVGIAAFAMAACAAFFSVFGFSQLFAGAATAVIIMFASLEFSKLVTAAALHRYWDKLHKAMRGYLTAGVIVMIMMTSAGTYGFLTSAYQETANKLELHEGGVKLLDNKINTFQLNIERNTGQIEQKNKRINQLIDLRQTQETRLDSLMVNEHWVNVKRTQVAIQQADDQIKELTVQVDDLNSSSNSLMDSVNVYNVQKLELESGNEVAAEVGPLKYLSELTGLDMDSIVNVYALIIILVFDPMAVMLLIVFSRIVLLEEEEEAELIKSSPAGTVQVPIKPKFNTQQKAKLRQAFQTHDDEVPDEEVQQTQPDIYDEPESIPQVISNPKPKPKGNDNYGGGVKPQ